MLNCICFPLGTKFLQLSRFDRPCHSRCIVRDSKPPLGVEQNDSSVPIESLFQVMDRFKGYLFWRTVTDNAVARPHGENQPHDRLSPPCSGRGGSLVVGIAAAANQ